MKKIDFKDPKIRNIIIWGGVGVIIILFAIVTVVATGGDDSAPTPETVYDVPSAIPSVLVSDNQPSDEELIRQYNAAAEQQRIADSIAMASTLSPSSPQEGAHAPSGDSSDPYEDIMRAMYGDRDGGNRFSDPMASAQVSPPGGSTGGLSADQLYRLEMYKMGLDPDTGRPISQSEDTGADSSQETASPESQNSEHKEETVVFRRTGGVSSVADSGSNGITGMSEDDEWVSGGSSMPVKVMFTDDQKVGSGDRVTLRLLEDVVVGNLLIPANTHLFATVEVGARMNVSVGSININGQITPLNFVGYDAVDGKVGLYLPSSSSAQEAAGTVASDAMSLADQALTAGVTGTYAQSITRTGLSLIRGTSSSKKTKVKISAGYTFYLVRDKR